MIENIVKINVTRKTTNPLFAGCVVRSFLLLLLLTLLPCFAQQTAARDYHMLHYTVADGLPSNTVYYVYRDTKGFLWIATTKGVARYNGIRFEVFTTVDGMPDNEIFSIREDKYGRIWFATFNGSLCYYKDNRFHNAKNTPFLKRPILSSLIKKIVLENDSSVTMMFENNEKMVNINKDHLSLVYLNNDQDINGFIGVKKLSKSLYKFIYRNCVKTVDSNHNLISRAPFFCTFNGTPCVDCDMSSAQDQIYIYNQHFIYDIDLKLVKQLNNIEGKVIPKVVYFDGNKNLFRCTDDGMYINDSEHVLAGLHVATVTEDIHHNCWMGTLTDGIYVMNYTSTYANVYPKAYTGEIWYAYADDGNLFYVNSDNNLYRLNETQECLFNYAPYKKMEHGYNRGFLVMKDNVNKQYNYINFINNYVFNTQDILGKKNFFVSEHPFNEPEVVKSITDVKDQIFVRTKNKVFSIKYSHFTDPATLNVKNILLANNSDRIRAFAKSPDNEVWFSTTFGVYKIIDGEDSVQAQFKDITFNKFDFLGAYLVGYTLIGNMLLVCSNINGKPVIDTIKQNATWDNFYKVDSAHMLISTNDLYRLFTINPPGSRQRYTVTAIENPFIPSPTEKYVGMAADKKFCYFFYNGSIVKLGIDNLYQKAQPPNLYFNSIKYGGRSFPMQDGLRVHYSSQKNISISFSTLSFSGKNISYLYSVSKNDQDNWTPLRGENFDFIIPGTGKWIIKVKAKSISSEYSKPIVYVLDIIPPFWATWWFNTLCIIIATTLVVFGVRYRILWVLKKTEKENETKIRFMKSEYKALNALMNPHFIFNTLNNVQALVNRNDKLAANEYLRIFADLVRQNMHNVSKENIPLQKEIDLVENYLALEKLRFKELMNYEIDVDDDVDTSLITVPPLFIQPLVENSIKHGILPKQSEDSKIILKVFEVGDVVHIEVWDNGVGLSAAKKKANALHESFGLKNIQDRVEQLSMIMGKKVEFNMEEVMRDDGSWTVVSIKMQV